VLAKAGPHQSDVTCGRMFSGWASGGFVKSPIDEPTVSKLDGNRRLRFVTGTTNELSDSRVEACLASPAATGPWCMKSSNKTQACS
jgi:hypothetical protein